MTVSGWTNVNESRQLAQYRDRKTQRARSRFVKRGFFGVSFEDFKLMSKREVFEDERVMRFQG